MLTLRPGASTMYSNASKAPCTLKKNGANKIASKKSECNGRKLKLEFESSFTQVSITSQQTPSKELKLDHSLFWA